MKDKIGLDMASIVPYHYHDHLTLTRDSRGLLCWTGTHCGVNWLRQLQQPG